MQRYINFLRDETRRNSRQSANTRTEDVRARELEQRIAIKDRRLQDIDEVNAVNDLGWGSARDRIKGLPARFAAKHAISDLHLRRALEKEVDDICNEIASDIERIAAALGDPEGKGAGLPYSEPVEDAAQDDAGPVGEGE